MITVQLKSLITLTSQNFLKSKLFLSWKVEKKYLFYLMFFSFKSACELRAGVTTTEKKYGINEKSIWNWGAWLCNVLGFLYKRSQKVPFQRLLHPPSHFPVNLLHGAPSLQWPWQGLHTLFDIYCTSRQTKRVTSRTVLFLLNQQYFKKRKTC